MVTEHTLAAVGVWKPIGVEAAPLRLKQPAGGRKSGVSAPVQNHHHPRHADPNQEEASRCWDESGTMSSTCQPLKALSSADKRVKTEISL